MYVTPTPTPIVLATGLGPGSIRQTTPSCSAVTQTLPAPTAIAVGAGDVSGTVWPGRFVRGSIRVTEPSPLPIHSAPRPAAMSVGVPRARIWPVTAIVLGSMREIVWSSALSTHTAPSPTAMLLGALPDSMNDATRSPRGPIAATPL